MKIFTTLAVYKDFTDLSGASDTIRRLIADFMLILFGIQDGIWALATQISGGLVGASVGVAVWAGAADFMIRFGTHFIHPLAGVAVGVAASAGTTGHIEMDIGMDIGTDVTINSVGAMAVAIGSTETEIR
jgi:hypothetical protein